VSLSCLTKDKKRLELSELEAFSLLLEFGTNPLMGTNHLMDFDLALESIESLQQKTKSDTMLQRLQTLQAQCTFMLILRNYVEC